MFRKNNNLHELIDENCIINNKIVRIEKEEQQNLELFPLRQLIFVARK